MNENERLDGIKAFWNENSDSEWYRSLRTEEKIHALQERPERVFHPAVYALIRKIFPDLTKAKVLLPSSGDNHAAFALSLLGAQVTSADISERQLENAAEIAARLRLNIEFVCDDTMAAVPYKRSGLRPCVHLQRHAFVDERSGQHESKYLPRIKKGRLFRDVRHAPVQQAVFRRSLAGAAHHQILSGCITGLALADSGYPQFADSSGADALRDGGTACDGRFLLVHLCGIAAKEPGGAGRDQRLEEKPHGRAARMAGVGFAESGVKNAGLRLVQSVGTGQAVSAL